MSDTTLNRFLGSGTTADRTAFTPSPPTPASGPDPGYTFWDTDLQTLFAWDAAQSAWVTVSSGDVAPPPPNGSVQTSFLVSGGAITWIANYDFTVSAASYFIQGLLYSSPQTDVTLSAADPTNDRIDVIVANTSSAIAVVQGTPAANPSEPPIDPATQLALGIVIVPAASTSPSGVSNEVVYFEDAGGPGEWNWTASGTSFNVASTNNPKSPATKDIELTSAVAGDYAQGQIASGTFDPNTAAQLTLSIRSKAAWAKNRGLTISLFNAGVLVGSAVTINRTGSFGFDSSITGSYQQLGIPITNFAVPAGTVITQLRITAFGSGFGCYIGDIFFQVSTFNGGSGGLTQAQADARYAPLGPSFVTLATDATLPNERVLTAGPGVSLTDGGAGGTVTISATSGGSGINQLTGDVTAGPGTGSQAATLAASGVTAGTYGDGMHVSQVTVDAKGRVTAASSVAITASGGAPVGAEYVTLATDGSLTAERVLTGTANQITITDNGAGSTVVLSTPQDLATTSTPQFARVGLGTAADTTAVLTANGQYYSPEVTDTVSAGAATIDWNGGNEHYLSLTANTTLTFSNPKDGGRYVLALQQDATGSRTVTWPATVLWSGGTAPTLTTTASQTDLFTFYYSGVLSKYIGNYALNF